MLAALPQVLLAGSLFPSKHPQMQRSLLIHRNLREGSVGGYSNNARISSLSTSDNTLIARLMIRRVDRPAPCT